VANLSAADQSAIEKVLAVKPSFQGIKAASDAVSMDKNTILHAGPAFAKPADITRPILNSAIVALVFEGVVSDFDAAEQMILSGEAVLNPAQDYDVVIPLAACVTSSFMLQEIGDIGHSGRTAYTPINGGNSLGAMRLGVRTDKSLELVRWLNGEFAEALSGAFGDPISLLSIAKIGIEAGDDCHGRTPAATAALAEALAPRLRNGQAAEKAAAFIKDSPSYFLNLWMASVRCMLRAASGTEDSSLLIGAGGNGAEVGIKIAGLPDRWFVASADPPNHQMPEGIPEGRALGAIGDSAIVDAMGFGAMAMNFAPEQKRVMLNLMPEDGLELPALLLAALHPGFGDLGLCIGMAARTVVENGRQPVVSLGVLDNEGELGRVAGGVYTTPMTVFRDAISALEAA
tara:strand:+ start:630 stop:1832 length:1203 start_codon:yes stop_codon:yes gene_type:complete